LKLKIEDYCIRCGICITMYPELYEMDFKEDVVRVKAEEITMSLTEKATQSIRDCAVMAIHVKK
jgi:ferredoxin